MIRVLNTTTDATADFETFEDAFSWGVSGLPGPHDRLLLNRLEYKAEFEFDGRTCFVDHPGRTSATTVEIWDIVRLGEDFVEW